LSWKIRSTTITAVIIVAVISQTSKGTFIEGVVMAKFYL